MICNSLRCKADVLPDQASTLPCCGALLRLSDAKILTSIGMLPKRSVDLFVAVVLSAAIMLVAIKR